MEYKKFSRIIGIVIWYNPSEKEGQTVTLYNSDVEHVIIVDNSASDNRHLCEHMNNVTYIPCMENKGIAAALNIGCEEALRQGADWALTMDQDSRWDQVSVRQYIEEVAQYEAFDRVAIFSPFHDIDGTPEKHHRTGRFEQRNVVMCSGNLLRLAVWQQAGGFREEFFIDLVDDEICCHVRELGWQVVRANNILLTHTLGGGVRTLGFTHKQYIPHPAWRYYFIARNIHRMIHLYPAMEKYYRKQVGKYIKRLCLYDTEDKIHKLREFRRGWYDYK